MRDESKEPNAKAIRAIAKSILRLKPLAVVLTGGDPLFSPHLKLAVECLSGRVGLLVDTSAYTLTNSHVSLFKKHGVSVRISCDAEDPELNQSQRPLFSGYPNLAVRWASTAEAAFAGISHCLESRIPVTVQTVATSRTVHDLPGFGDKLYKLGVTAWRVFKVADSASRHEPYIELVRTVDTQGKRLPGKDGDGPYKYIFQKLIDLSRSRWSSRMAVQVTLNETPNAVILVGPDGKFYTESNVRLGKVEIDPQKPKQPRLSAIRSRVNMNAHMERYLNLTSVLK